MLRQRFHYLHIGKTAGTVTKSVMRSMNTERGCKARFILHSHRVSYSDLPKSEPYLFAVRDPIARFYSGFYSRKRKGQPRHFKEWSDGEAHSFERFPEANDLALALRGDERFEAIFAMRSISHLRRRYIDVLDDMHAILESHKPAFILRQSSLESDFRAFAGKFNLSPVPEFPKGKVEAHKNSYDDTPPLSDEAIEILQVYLADEIAYYQRLMELAEEVNTAPSSLNASQGKYWMFAPLSGLRNKLSAVSGVSP